MADSAPASFLVDLVIHTSSDIGSPRVAGSTSAFNAAVSSGSVSASFLGPPPGACTRLLGLLAALGFAVSGAAPSNPSDRHFRPAGASFTLTDRDAPLKCLFEGLRQRCHPGASAQPAGHKPARHADSTPHRPADAPGRRRARRAWPPLSRTHGVEPRHLSQAPPPARDVARRPWTAATSYGPCGGDRATDALAARGH
jgi:hypothetical protein